MSARRLVDGDAEDEQPVETREPWFKREPTNSKGELPERLPTPRNSRN